MRDFVEVHYSPIGTIRSPFSDVANMPIQTTAAAGVEGAIEIEQKYVEGLKDLDGFSHIVVLYHFHEVSAPRLTVIPFLDTQPRGVFSTRAPTRPNPIGLSVVKLVGIEENVLRIENVDMLDGTPVLDIKPYIPALEPENVDRIGWLAGVVDKAKETRSDARFEIEKGETGEM